MYLKMDAAMKNGNRADIFHSVMRMFHTAHNMEYRIKRYRAEKDWIMYKEFVKFIKPTIVETVIAIY